jgi:hypothetical protein
MKWRAGLCAALWLLLNACSADRVISPKRQPGQYRHQHAIRDPHVDRVAIGADS